MARLFRAIFPPSSPWRSPSQLKSPQQQQDGMVTFRQIYFADELPQRRVWRGAGVAACRYGAFAPGTHYGVWSRQRHEAVMGQNGAKSRAMMSVLIRQKAALRAPISSCTHPQARLSYDGRWRAPDCPVEATCSGPRQRSLEKPCWGGSRCAPIDTALTWCKASRGVMAPRNRPQGPHQRLRAQGP